MSVLKSVGAVMAGMVSGMLVVMVLTYLAALLLFDGDLTAPPTPGYLVGNVAYSFGAGVLAGWIAAHLAPSRPLAHAAGVAAIMLALSAGSGSTAPGVPGWYQPLLATLMPVAAVLGGYIRSRRASVVEDG